MSLDDWSTAPAVLSLTRPGAEPLIIEGGALTIVTAATGAATTSLLWSLAGADDQAALTLDGHPIPDEDQAREAGIRIIPVGNGLAATLTAQENIALPLLRALPPEQAQARALEALDAVGLLNVADHLVEELSGGQQQRAAIAWALAAQPRVLVADEPTSDLDGANRDRVIGLLESYAASGAIVVIATDDAKVAQRAGTVHRAPQ